MQTNSETDQSLFLNILHTLERINAPYMIIGAFAGTIYGITRVTFDIDILVDLMEEHILALAAAYPLPRYYADPEMMRNSINRGIMFNIIDTSRGEKADLIPLTPSSVYSHSIQRRVRQAVEIPGAKPFDVWIAAPEDVILGKLTAWAEGRSRKHENDIYEMMVFHYLNLDPTQSADFDEGYINSRAAAIGIDVLRLWRKIRVAAQKEADREDRG